MVRGREMKGKGKTKKRRMGKKESRRKSRFRIQSHLASLRFGSTGALLSLRQRGLHWSGAQ